MLPNIKEIINKHLQILSIDSSFKEIFNNLQPMIAFHKITSLKQLTGTNAIRNNQKVLTAIQTTTTGPCTPFYTSQCFAANKSSKQQYLQALKPEKSLAIEVSCARFSMLESLKDHLISD